MKRFILLILFAMIGLGVAACGNQEEEVEAPESSDTESETPSEEETTTEQTDDDQSWATVEERGTLIVGTSGTYRPVTFYDESNTLTGFDVELIRAIAEYLDVEVDFQTMDFDGILPALRNGQIDMAINDFAITEERLEIFDFTDPYKFSYGSIVVRTEDLDQFESAEDLEGVPVALGSLTSNYARFSEYIGADGIAYDGGTEAILRDILNGNRDAYLNDRLVLQRTLDEFGDDDLAVATQVKYHSTSSAMPVLKGNLTLVERLNEAIASLREDGTIGELSIEFLGEDASEPIDSEDVLDFDF